MTAADWYDARIAHWTAKRDAANARATTVSRLRLVSFLGGGALIWWGLAAAATRTPAIAIGAAAIVVFAMLVIRHARIIDEGERGDAAIDFNTRGLARLARDWNALPEVPPPPDMDFDAHPYARDLDLFGHASLTKWFGRPATSDGSHRFWTWLLAPAAPDVIRDRQSAVDELAREREWRETLAVEGIRTTVTPQELSRFLEWAESDRPSPSRESCSQSPSCCR